MIAVELSEQGKLMEVLHEWRRAMADQTVGSGDRWLVACAKLADAHQAYLDSYFKRSMPERVLPKVVTPKAPPRYCTNKVFHGDRR